MLTINQALDQILTKYKGKDMESLPDVQALKQHLVELKIVWGGNTPVENEKVVKGIIKHGTANK